MWFLTVLCLTCAPISGTLQESEIQWAFDYLSETIENVEKPQVLPNGYLVTFPKESHEGWALKNNEHGLKWWTEAVPIWGTILVKADWTIGSVKDRSILVHEACHILDMKTAAGCRCDPYFIQYTYLLENGYSMEQVKLLYHLTMHDPSRACHIKGTLSKKSEPESNSKSHRVP